MITLFIVLVATENGIVHSIFDFLGLIFVSVIYFFYVCK